MIDASTLDRIRAALGDEDRATRADAVDALAAMRDVAGLRAALRSPDPYLRYRAVRALGSIAGRRVTGQVLAARRDADERVRLAVAEALGVGAHSWRIARALRRLVSLDPSPAVRCAALAGLARVEARWVDRLLQSTAAEDDAALVRDAAAAILLRRHAPRDGAACSPAGGPNPYGAQRRREET